MTRDPRTDPQPGDVIEGGTQKLLVLKRTSDMVLVDGGSSAYWISVERWQQWCEEIDAKVIKIEHP